MRSIPPIVAGAALLVAALAACSATDMSRSLAPSENNRTILAGGCPGNYALIYAGTLASIDRNGDGSVCEMVIDTPSGNRKRLYIDNSVSPNGTCPDDFPTPVNLDQTYDLGSVDQNQNRVVCQNLAADAWTDDNR